MDRLYNSTTNLNNYAHYALKGYENSTDFAAFKLVELSTASTLARNPAYRIIGTYGGLSTGFRELMEVGTIIDNKAYIKQFSVDAMQYYNYLPTAQNMIDSLAIKSSTR